MSRDLRSSLKWKLLLDLSVLTVCALLFGASIFVVLGRLQLTDSLGKQAPVVLQSVHQELWASGLLSSETLEEINLRLEDREIQLSSLYTQLESPEFQVLYEPYLLFLSRPRAFQWSTPVEASRVLVYEWRPADFDRAFGRLKWGLFLSSVLVALILVVLSYHFLFKRNFFNPIRNIWMTTNAFIAENWGARCFVERKDELGQISETLNEMAKKIQEKEKKLVLTIQSLQQASEEIEATKNEQLQVEKLASVGRLAAGVAHEVGNPLGAISGYVDILKRALRSLPDASAEDIELCDRIEAETARISRIIRALLEQAKPPQDRIRPVHLRTVIERSLDLAQVPDSIGVKLDFEEDSAEALCEQDQLIQVLLNLIINAKHAIEEKFGSKTGGKIEIRCRLRRLTDQTHQQLTSSPEPEDFNTSLIRILKPQRYWVISVIDNGSGINDEDRKKLFEPFFSTKQTGQGTGLGLYVAKSIIESFRGTISVQSAKGSGSAFSVFLPKGLT
ncbi:MAG: hypothetical protein EA369_05650 [Bradymonadales bacterium]|nr:MAG: hypothetical protein EA369_05650 [Bradymonadales bacterium]